LSSSFPREAEEALHPWGTTSTLSVLLEIYYHILASYGKAKNIVDKTEPICFIAAIEKT
jgi:hypothetical protein